MLVFDISDRQSYENAIQRWHNQIIQSKEMPVILVANKADLENHQVQEEEIK
jgi:GTPase SAR1 family protein